MANIKDIIDGLYIAYFNRASDLDGYNYWKNEATKYDTSTVIKKLSASFAAQPKFHTTYDSLSNKEFVEKIYKNILNSPGDTDGINYWTNILDSGVKRSDMIADFVVASIDFDKDLPQYKNLSKEEINLATKRHDQLLNKIEVSKLFKQKLQEKTNLSPSTNSSDEDSLNSDKSYIASIKILSNITEDKNTIYGADANLEIALKHTTPIDYLATNPIKKYSTKNPFITNNITQDTTGIKELDSTYHWSHKTITYSFPTSLPDDYKNEQDTDLVSGWQELSSSQKQTFRQIAKEVNSLFDINLTETLTDGDIRVNLLDMPSSDTAGFAYIPKENYSLDGDIFLSKTLSQTEFRETIIHELGHALGLKHPFEGDYALRPELDDTLHTVMSYTNRYDTIPTFTKQDDKVTVTYEYKYPNLYALYDIDTLDYIYGENSQKNLDNTTYSYDFYSFPIDCIYDAGGVDTIDLSNTKSDTTISLKPGSINSIDQHSLSDIIKYYQDKLNYSQANDWVKDIITDLYNQDSLYTGKNNLSISSQTIIENIKTGSGNDKVTDNYVDNDIYTNSGDDTIYIGEGGIDFIDGGDGYDKLYFDIRQSDIIDTQTQDETNIIYADNFIVKFVGIEELDFTDHSILTGDLFS